MTTLAKELSPLVNPNGSYNMAKIVRLIGVQKQTITQMTGIADLRESRELSKANRDKIKPLIKILTYLIYEFKGSEEDIRRWIHSPKVQWYGYSPLDMMEEHKFAAVEAYLKRHCDTDPNLFKG
ncbi:MAG: DUF2384 domain-containing protein [Zetaproteobacteria bacterium]|nr:DUF2384 domain-containing protein [Zetaproteobacteria bacterium]